MAHLHALPNGHEFEGYRIERVLGAGGFGITYLATEVMIGRAVAIKEFLPNSVAARAVDSLTVHPLVAADADIFRWGLKRFRNEARTLVSFHHPNIVSVYRYFEANGTAYLVMAYENGGSLAELLKTRRTLPEAEILAFLDPLLDGIAQVHAAGFLHRDIKPANIIIRPNGKPALIDFGAARQSFGEKSQSSRAIVSPGFAPFEQYTSSTEQGAWTDIYALGATLYACVTATRPVEAPDRVAGATMRSAAEIAGGRYSPAFLAAIDRALALMPEDRPQNVADWRASMDGQPQPTRVSESTLAPAKGQTAPTQAAGPVPATVSAVAATAATVAPKAHPSRRAFHIGLIAGAVTLMSAGGYAVMRSQIEAERKRAEAEAKRRALEDEERRSKQQQADADAARKEREDGQRRQAEAAAQKGRAAQVRALAAERQANAARQQAVLAADCARNAATRAQNGERGYYSGRLKRGTHYEGQVNEATYTHGCGVETETDGGRYEGQHVGGSWQGYGVRRTKDGLRYEGGYKAGAPDGYGAVRFADGKELRVTLVRGKVIGPGVWVNADGTRFEGDIVEEHWSGYGVVRYTDGAMFEGEFSGSRAHGLGVRTNADGSKLYGRWEKSNYMGPA